MSSITLHSALLIQPYKGLICNFSSFKMSKHNSTSVIFMSCVLTCNPETARSHHSAVPPLSVSTVMSHVFEKPFRSWLFSTLYYIIILYPDEQLDFTVSEEQVLDVSCPLNRVRNTNMSRETNYSVFMICLCFLNDEHESDIISYKRNHSHDPTALVVFWCRAEPEERNMDQ